jgi:hypothetical protein
MLPVSLFIQDIQIDKIELPIAVEICRIVMHGLRTK